MFSNDVCRLIVALVTVGFAVCSGSAHRESAVFSNVKREVIAFPTSSLDMGVAKIQPPGQPAYGIVTPIPHEDLFTQGLAPEAMVGKLKQLPDTEGRGDIAPSNFVASPVFADFLNRVIAEQVPNVAEYQIEARAIRNGWLYVIDRRGPAKTDPVPTRDVIGAFAVRDGIIQSTSYRRNELYLLFTEDGFSVLHRDLTDALMKALLSVNAHQSQRPNRR